MTHMTSDSLFSFRRLAISLFMLLTMSGVSLLAHANGSSAPSGTITEWNATFADNAGPKGSIQALAMWDDGSGEALYAGASNTSSSGPFTAAGGIAMGYIGRWNGTSWSPLGTGLDGPVSQIVPFGDELIVSGQFQTAGGLIVNGIASWNGQRWRRFGNQPSPAALAIFQGALVGALPAQNPVGSSVYVVVRWNGVSWDELGPGMEQPISALVDFNGVLVAGGNFSTAGGVQARFIAQWTGSQWLPIGNGLNGWVTSLTVHQGQLVAGSRYGLMVGQNSIARWDGNAWTSPGTLQGRAYTLAVWNGDLIVGGNNPNGYLMRWSGANWDPMAGNTDGPIQTLLAHAGQLYAGGNFRFAGTTPAAYLASWDGLSWAPTGSGINAPVLTSTILGSDLVVGGNFRNAGGLSANYVARWVGGQWSTLGDGLPGRVIELAQHSGQLVAASYLSSFSDSQVSKWNGNAWTALGSGMNGAIGAIGEFNNDLVAAGGFTTAGGVPVERVARWTGGAWTAMGTLPLNDVRKMVVFNQELIIAGNGDAAIYRWSGVDWLPLGGDQADIVTSLAVYNGELIASAWRNYPNNASYEIRRWDGQSWSLLGNGLAGQAVYTFAVHNGELLASGGSGNTRRVWRWDGSEWSVFGENFEYVPLNLISYQGQLIAGGAFARAGSQVSPFIIAYGPALSTQTVITQTSPSSSAIGQLVQITVEVSATTAPTKGHVTVTGTPGGSCTDLTLTPINATTSQAQCSIQWNTACNRTLTADFVGGTDGNHVWQSGSSAPYTHPVSGVPVCSQMPLFSDGFE